ncbi:hypothetical protein KCU81_g8458, partial [Aureobasidium melanogenum]|uniref:CBM1 domain-containing protein n=1 Tax=Aureobasidium melanogenum (strain CBS 110374) TaxID=1043003 RepID=A0A074VC39_AURM1
MTRSFLKTAAVCLAVANLSNAAAVDKCNADNCLRAVRASSHAPFPSSATADCISFLRKTVTPCVVSSYITQTVTVTATPVTITQTNTAQLTVPTTEVVSVTSVATSLDLTATSFTSSEVDVTQTSYTTVVTSILPAKRDAGYKAPLDAPVFTNAKLQGRAVSTTANTCAATTTSASSVPTYASACSGTVRYSSACQCAGLTAATTTLTASTTIITDTITVTVTPTATAQATQTQTISETTTSTDIIPTTISTTVTTVVVTEPYTVTTSVVIPTTIGQNYCRSYLLVATAGHQIGQYVTASIPSQAISYGNPELTSDVSQAMSYVLGSDGRLYGNNIYQVETTSNPAYNYLQQMNTASSAYYEANYGYSPLHCSVAIAGVNVVGSSAGALSCTLQGSAIFFQTCTNVNYPNLLISGPSVNYAYGCADPLLAAIFNGFTRC